MVSADAAREALAEAHRLLDTCLDDVDTFERDDLIKRMEDVRYILIVAEIDRLLRDRRDRRAAARAGETPA